MNRPLLFMAFAAVLAWTAYASAQNPTGGSKVIIQNTVANPGIVTCTNCATGNVSGAINVTVTNTAATPVIVSPVNVNNPTTVSCTNCGATFSGGAVNVTVTNTPLPISIGSNSGIIVNNANPNGQGTMATSSPVVLPSDQSPITVTCQNCGSINLGSALNVTVVNTASQPVIVSPVNVNNPTTVSCTNCGASTVTGPFNVTVTNTPTVTFSNIHIDPTQLGALGQTNMNNSAPVVIASDQTAIPVTTPDIISITNALSLTPSNTALVITMANIDGTAGFSITGLSNKGAQINLESSVDNGNTWIADNCVNDQLGTLVNAAATDLVCHLNTVAKSTVRWRVQTPTPGSVNIAYDLSQGSGIISLGSPLPAGTNNIGTITVANAGGTPVNVSCGNCGGSATTITVVNVPTSPVPVSLINANSQLPVSLANNSGVIINGVPTVTFANSLGGPMIVSEKNLLNVAITGTPTITFANSAVSGPLLVSVVNQNTPLLVSEKNVLSVSLVNTTAAPLPVSLVNANSQIPISLANNAGIIINGTATVTFANSAVSGPLLVSVVNQNTPLLVSEKNVLSVSVVNTTSTPMPVSLVNANSSLPISIANNGGIIVNNANANGQAVMANSSPIVIASNQSTLTVAQTQSVTTYDSPTITVAAYTAGQCIGGWRKITATNYNNQNAEIMNFQIVSPGTLSNTIAVYLLDSSPTNTICIDKTNLFRLSPPDFSRLITAPVLLALTPVGANILLSPPTFAVTSFPEPIPFVPGGLSTSNSIFIWYALQAVTAFTPLKTTDINTIYRGRALP